MDEISNFIDIYGAATVFAFEMIDELEDNHIGKMAYVNGLMLNNRGVNTPQFVIIEEHDTCKILKFVLAGDVSKHADFVYKNISVGFFEKKHEYLGMSVENV